MVKTAFNNGRDGRIRRDDWCIDVLRFGCRAKDLVAKLLCLLQDQCAKEGFAAEVRGVGTTTSQTDTERTERPPLALGSKLARLELPFESQPPCLLSHIYIHLTPYFLFHRPSSSASLNRRKRTVTFALP
jgi:hypothetical protein